MEGESNLPSDRKRPFEATSTEPLPCHDPTPSLGSESRTDTEQITTTVKPKRTKAKHQDPSVRAARSKIQQCCARNDLQTAMEIFDQALLDGTRVEAQSFYNLLSLCDGLSDRGIHVGTPKHAADSDKDSSDGIAVRPVTETKRLKHAERIKERMDQLQLPLTETAYSALIKLYSRNHQFDQAESFLQEAESVDQCRPKLRMYSALMAAYCRVGRMHDALQVWLRLSKQQLVVSEKEYLVLVQCATSQGYARVMQRVLSDMSEDGLVPSRETIRAIEAWYQSPWAVEPSETKDCNSSDDMLQQIQVPYSNVSYIDSGIPVQSPYGWLVDGSCTINTSSGVLNDGCLKGCGLQPVSLSDACWNEMMVMNETIVATGKLEGDDSGVQGGRKGPKRLVTNSEQRMKYWNAFKNYLEKQCTSGNYEVIIDGANVGYFQQNFQSAPKHVDYRQIDWVVRHFQRMNKKVLLVMHSRHFAPNLMPREFVPIERSWRDAGVLYCTPPGMNDDWFWLHAALHVRNSFVLTNDEMRDHHFQMLAPRSFLRWKDRHQVRFSFGSWLPGRSRQVNLQYPSVYSRRIQQVEDGLVLPRAKRGDERRFLDGVHVATDGDPVEETYSCIRPKTM